MKHALQMVKFFLGVLVPADPPHLGPDITLTPAPPCTARNLGEYFVSLLDEPSNRKNLSPSDKKVWRFLKNVSVAEKS